MKAKFLGSIALVGGLLAVCSPIFAHHGSAAYDNTKVVVLKNATVTKVNWGNPHTLVLFDVKDDKGNVVHWVVESEAASAVSATGWTKNAIQPGDVITVYLYQVKNGEFIGRTGKIVLSDGTVFGHDGALGADRPSQCDKDFGPGGNESAACRPNGRQTSNKE
jgi:Family of unknown function (DUF6152)